MLTTEQYDEIKNKQYTSKKKSLDNLLASGGIPNIKAFNKVIKDLKNRINIVENGSAFAQDLEEVTKAEVALANLSGELMAFEETLKEIKRKIKEHSNL